MTKLSMSSSFSCMDEEGNFHIHNASMSIFVVFIVTKHLILNPFRKEYDLFSLQFQELRAGDWLLLLRV